MNKSKTQINSTFIMLHLPEFTHTKSPGRCKNLYNGTFAADKSSIVGHHDPCK